MYKPLDLKVWNIMRSPHKGYTLREQSKTAVHNFFGAGASIPIVDIFTK